MRPQHSAPRTRARIDICASCPPAMYRTYECLGAPPSVSSSDYPCLFLLCRSRCLHFSRHDLDRTSWHTSSNPPSPSQQARKLVLRLRLVLCIRLQILDTTLSASDTTLSDPDRISRSRLAAIYLHVQYLDSDPSLSPESHARARVRVAASVSVSVFCFCFLPSAFCLLRVADSDEMAPLPPPPASESESRRPLPHIISSGRP